MLSFLYFGMSSKCFFSPNTITRRIFTPILNMPGHCTIKILIVYNPQISLSSYIGKMSFIYQTWLSFLGWLHKVHSGYTNQIVNKFILDQYNPSVFNIFISKKGRLDLKGSFNPNEHLTYCPCHFSVCSQVTTPPKKRKILHLHVIS